MHGPPTSILLENPCRPAACLSNPTQTTPRAQSKQGSFSNSGVPNMVLPSTHTHTHTHSTHRTPGPRSISISSFFFCSFPPPPLFFCLLVPDVEVGSQLKIRQSINPPPTSPLSSSIHPSKQPATGHGLGSLIPSNPNRQDKQTDRHMQKSTPNRHLPKPPRSSSITCLCLPPPCKPPAPLTKHYPSHFQDQAHRRFVQGGDVPIMFLFLNPFDNFF